MNTWFLISDTRTLRQQKLRCRSRDISVPFLVAPPNSLNGTAGVSSTSELISVTAETVLQKLEKQKAKLAVY